MLRNLLHFLDAVFVDSFQILCSVNENRGYEMTKTFKYIPANKQPNTQYSKQYDNKKAYPQSTKMLEDVKVLAVMNNSIRPN